MFPFLVNTDNFEYPLSGDVTQDISPAFISAMKGVPEIEWEIVTSVASYGDQLGALTDAVLELARAAGVEGEKLSKLQEIADGVEAAKKRAKGALKARAEASLRRLEQVDPEAHKKLTGGELCCLSPGNEPRSAPSPEAGQDALAFGRGGMVRASTHPTFAGSALWISDLPPQHVTALNIKIL